MNKYIKLAKLNLRNYRKQSRFFVIILTACCILYLVTVTVSEGYRKICNNYKTEDIKLREIEFWPNEDEQFDTGVMKKIENLSHVSDVSQYFNVDFSDNYSIEIGGTKLKCLPFLRGTNRSFSFSPMGTVLENNHLQYINPIISGRDFCDKDKKKAIIDENTCYILGFKNPKDILGKTVSLILSDLSISGIEIIGVCSYQYGFYYEDLHSLNSQLRKSYLNSELCNPLFFSDDIISDVVRSEDTIDWQFENLKVYVDDTENVKEVCDKSLENFGYASSNMVSVIETKAKNAKSASILLFIIATIILLTALISIVNTLIIKIQCQKKFTQMILKIGYRKKDIIFIYILENIFISIKAELVALCISILACTGIDIFLSNGYSEVSTYSRFVFLLNIPNATLFCLFVIMVVSFHVYIVSYFQIRKLGREMVLK